MPLIARTRLRSRALSVAAVAATVALGACSSDQLSRNFGLTRDAPDEFMVTTRAPLSMPPDFQIRPPRPGAPRPQEETTSSAAEAALVPQAALSTQQAGMTPGQAALLNDAGPAAPANIRDKVESEASLDRPKQSLTDRLMFWKSPPPAGVVVDANKESQRIRENAALGQSMEQGDTPIIQRNKSSSSGILGIF